MGSRGLRLAVAALAAVALAATVGAAGFVHLGHGATPARPGPSCAMRLIADWSHGGINGTYPIRCYRAALKSLPTDLEVYSSAPEDIASALSARLADQKASPHRGTPSGRRLASATGRDR